MGRCPKPHSFFEKKSAVPTAKLDVCDIKIVTAHPDGVIKIEKRPTIDNNRRAHFFWK